MPAGQRLQELGVTSSKLWAFWGVIFGVQVSVSSFKTEHAGEAEACVACELSAGSRLARRPGWGLALDSGMARGLLSPL